MGAAWDTARMAEMDAPEDAAEDAPQQPEGPSLELPSFGFRRKKKQRGAPAPPPPPVDVEPDPEPEPEPERTHASAPPPAPPPPPEPAPEPVPEPAPSPATEVRPAPERKPAPVGGGRRLFVEEAPSAAPEQEDAEPGRRARRRPMLPQLGAVPATLLTGLLVGLLTVGLVFASQGACELLRGTSSCGDAGFLLLLAVLVLAGWLGGTLLRALGVSEGGSTSFLAMGLVAVVLMLFLADELFRWWMVVVVPLVAMIAYVLAHRVSTAMVEPGGREMHR
jgi:hypothetical protein